MASLEPQTAPQGTFEHKSCSGCYTAPRWWKFSLPWRGCFLARSQRATEGDALLLSVRFPSKQELGSVRLIGGALSCVDCPWCGTTWLGRYVQLSGHDIVFPERMLANPLPHCLDSSFSPHIFQVSWMSPVLNPPEVLTMFKCWIDEHSWNFQWF